MSRSKPESRMRGGVRHIPDLVAEMHTANELKTIELLGLTTVNLVTDDTDYDVIITNCGDIVYSPVEG